MHRSWVEGTGCSGLGSSSESKVRLSHLGRTTGPYEAYRTKRSPITTQTPLQGAHDRPDQGSAVGTSRGLEDSAGSKTLHLITLKSHKLSTPGSDFAGEKEHSRLQLHLSVSLSLLLIQMENSLITATPSGMSHLPRVSHSRSSVQLTVISWVSAPASLAPLIRTWVGGRGNRTRCIWYPYA